VNSSPTSINYKFYWILTSSLILHIFVLSYISFPKAEKQPIEKIFEVQLQNIIVQAQKPLLKKSPTSKPLTKKPLTKKPLTKKPLLKQPLPKQPLPQQPLPQQLLPKQPLPKKPLPKKPLPKKPLTKKPLTQKPLLQKPLLQKPLLKKPLLQKSLLKKPLLQKPLTQKPLPKKPLTQKPLPQKPILQKRFAKKPLLIKPSPPKQIQYQKKTKILQPQKPSIKKGVEKSNELTSDRDRVLTEKRITKTTNLLDKPLPAIKPVAKPSLEKPLTSQIENIEVITEKNDFLDPEVKVPVMLLNQPSKIQIKEQNTKSERLLKEINANQIKTSGKLLKGIKANQIKTVEKAGDIKANEIKQTTDNYEIKTPLKKNNNVNPITSTNIFSNLKIEGEVSRRKLIYQPKAPNLDIDKDLTISLKFSVLPSGVVNQIIPFKKADPDLEKLATGLLLQYRFEPLFGEKDIQYGIIHFTIKRSN
jgi:periplasmic protein TonB